MYAVEQQTKEKQIVLKAVDELGRRVTVADVAAKTGLPILKVNSELNKIAAETEGHMEVATTGDIAYKFADNFQSAYAKKGMELALQKIWDKTFEVGFFLVRISFGIMLIVSLIVLVVVLFIVIQALNKNNDSDDGIFGGGFHMSFFDYLILRELMWYGTYSSMGRSYYRLDQPTYRRPETKGNFLFNCFSFLFGDGNPNLNLEERKWAMIAEVIRKNHGVVTADQLAPYTGADPGNEDGVLPVLVRFDGRPEVSEEGHIIYSFPSLQASTSELSQFRDLPSYLGEFPYKFTNVDSGELTMVYILAAINFFGSWILLFQVGGMGLYELLPLMLLLVIYGSLFVTVPFVRHIVNQVRNSRIESRNEQKRQYSLRLEAPSDELLRKLAAAKRLKLESRVLRAEDNVYTTERDALEQEFDASP